MEWLFSIDIWMSFLTLVVLEIILGIDNIIFLSIIATRLPAEKQKKARIVGLTLALLMRILLLLSLSWLTHITVVVFNIADYNISWRDIVLGLGGLFLLYKGTREIHSTVEGDDHDDAGMQRGCACQTVIEEQLVHCDAEKAAEGKSWQVADADPFARPGPCRPEERHTTERAQEDEPGGSDDLGHQCL